MRTTINGIPVELESSACWVVLRLAHDGTYWFVLTHTVADTRAEAIKRVGRFSYRWHRRRGEMIATWATVRPSCLPVTAGDAAMRVEAAP